MPTETEFYKKKEKGIGSYRDDLRNVPIELLTLSHACNTSVEMRKYCEPPSQPYGMAIGFWGMPEEQTAQRQRRRPVSERMPCLEIQLFVSTMYVVSHW